jgi:ESF2/ABP1 family protein
MSDSDQVNDDESVGSEGSVDHESENETEGDVEDVDDESEGGVDVEDEDAEEIIDVIKTKKPKKIHKLSLTETEDFNKKLKKRGVIYVARVPPRMTPSKIKSLLSDFAEVTRVFLVEEDASVRKRRKREYGGSGGKRYVEGWVELASKRKAKHIAASLNLTPISNTKRNPHYGKEYKKSNEIIQVTLYIRNYNLLTVQSKSLTE